LFPVLLLFLASPTFAQSLEQTSTDDDLLAVLTEATAVATKSRLNGDFVPGIVTVLHGDELESMGIETVWEALSLVPGAMPVRDSQGGPSVVVRGLVFPFNVKILVDSVPLSRESAGINGIALQIPIQLVERIEVIRGPGSVVYGDLAFLGFVNIVTRHEEQRVFVRGGGDKAFSAGVQLPFNSGSWSGLVMAEGLKNNTAPVAEPNQAKEKRGWGAFHIANGGFSFSAEGISRRVDQTSFGPQGPPPPAAQEHWAGEARYAVDITPELHSEFRLGYMRNRFDTAITEFSGSDTRIGADTTWSGWKRHQVLATIEFDAGRIDKASQSLPPIGNAPPRPPLVVSGKDRDVFGLTLQDSIEVSEKVSFTFGGRLDHYSDVGAHLTPRLAVVWRATDEHILKLQYGEGFRAPSFFELYAEGQLNPDLTFEVNRATEFNYVFRRPKSVGRATLFYSNFQDVIYIDTPPRFGNTRQARSFGAEIEWEQQLASSLKVQANVSWVDAEDDRNLSNEMTTPGVTANWLWNLGLLFRPIPALLFGARWNHVGSRNVPPPADNKGYDLVDLTATVNDLAVKGIQLRVGVKNVLDSDLRYYNPGRPGQPGGFMTFPGRTYFAQLAWGSGGK
jgi:iron complex outermembrane receptor protein